MMMQSVFYRGAAAIGLTLAVASMALAQNGRGDGGRSGRADGGPQAAGKSSPQAGSQSDNQKSQPDAASVRHDDSNVNGKGYDGNVDHRTDAGRTDDHPERRDHNYRWSANRWWYSMPGGRWMVWNQDRWVNSDQPPSDDPAPAANGHSSDNRKSSDGGSTGNSGCGCNSGCGGSCDGGCGNCGSCGCQRHRRCG